MTALTSMLVRAMRLSCEKEASTLTLEDQPQSSDKYYCGLCKAFMPISHFPHDTGKESKV